MPFKASRFHEIDPEMLERSLSISEGSDDPTRPILGKRTHTQSGLNIIKDYETK